MVVAELHGGNVYGNRSDGQAGVDPIFGLFAGFAEHPDADGKNHAAVFRNRNKLRGRDETANRMRPADERLAASDVTGAQINFRLIVKREFLTLDGAAQTFFDGLALDGANVHS